MKSLKNNFITRRIKDIAELIAQKRSIEDYENMSNDKLYDALRASENEKKR